VWLSDDRVPPRLLQVTNHSAQGLVVFSIWHENVCTATFQLSVSDAPPVIDALVAALADATQRRTRAIVAPPPVWSRFRAWARAKLTRSA
jgi:hypothetical protein